MDKARAKRRLAAVLLAIAAVTSTLLLVQIGAIVHRAASGARPADAFTPATEAPPGAADIEWEDDPPDLARAMEPPTRQLIADGYVAAWDQLEHLSTGGSAASVRTYFSGEALTALERISDRRAGRLHQISHHLALSFYSLDGSIVGFRDVAAVSVRDLGEGSPLIELEEAWDVVMLLRDGRWRVEQWQRLSGTARTELDAPPRARASATVGIGVNYYPSAHPWEAMWTQWDAATIDRDLGVAASLGFDDVRVFLHYDALGGPAPQPTMLARVERFLDLAERHRLAVTLTLFDGRSDHRPAAWRDDDRHLAGVVPALAGHPALAMWDLKNEPDRDMGREATTTEVRAWLAHVARTVRRLDPTTPMTIGWSRHDAVQLVDLVDVVSFHDYLPPGSLPARIAEVAELAGSRPVALQEFGLPTWRSVLPGGHTDAEQAHYVAQVLTATAEAGIGASVWTLYDLTRPPPDAGRLPWRTGPQTHLGILHEDGRAKPAAALFAPGADLDAVERPGWPDRLSKPFWRLTGAALAVAILAVTVSLRRRRRPAS